MKIIFPQLFALVSRTTLSCSSAPTHARGRVAGMGCRSTWSRASFFGAAFGTLAISFWRYMIPFSIAIDKAAAPRSSLAFMFWMSAVGLLQTVISYTVFRSKILPIAEQLITRHISLGTWAHS